MKKKKDFAGRFREKINQDIHMRKSNWNNIVVGKKIKQGHI